MSTTIRALNAFGETVGLRIVPDSPWFVSREKIKLYDDLYHPIISTANELVERYERYRYVHEQLALNAERSGYNLVDPETTRHILEGTPIIRVQRNEDGAEEEPATTITGWSGGHGNPNAAKYGKTQIPDFWTGERFMYEVSDVLADDSTRWFRQEASPTFIPDDDAPARFVCVEERYGVPIRIVADLVDDHLKCITAFPDYGDFPIDQRAGVQGNDNKKRRKRSRNRRRRKDDKQNESSQE